MEPDEIRYWRDQYDEFHDGFDELIDLREELYSIEGESSVTKSHLDTVVRWKLYNQGGRANRYAGLFEEIPDEYVQRITAAAFTVDDPQLQIQALTSIPGIGPAIASVVLAFNDPRTRAIGDRYLMDELLGEERGMTARDYPRLIEALVQENSGEFALRDVEKAVWERYRQRNEIEW